MCDVRARIADRIRGIRRIEVSSDNFRQRHKAGEREGEGGGGRYRVSFSSRPGRVTNAPSLPENETVGIRVESREGRKKMALFRGILLSLLIEEKKKKKKNASRSWRGEDSIFRPLRRGLTGCNGEPLRWRDEAKHLLTYLLTTEETTKKLHALTRSRAMLVKSSLR